MFCAQSLRYLLAAGIFDRAKPHHFLFGFRNSRFGYLTALFLFRPVAGLSFDALPFVVSAAAGDFLFLLLPACLFGTQRVFGGHATSIEFRSARCFLAP